MKNVKGTKTHENLKAAFAAESQANRRYLYYARAADIEGHPDLGGLFRDTSEAETGHVVKSPMVGTFYLAASPGGKPLVEVGASVKSGAPICIIEAMKIMNEIEADESGVIDKILCENGQAVEFGQPLFVIDRRG